jgi:hypothetical protein
MRHNCVTNKTTTTSLSLASDFLHPPPIMNFKSLQLLCGNAGSSFARSIGKTRLNPSLFVSILALAIAATAGQAEKAAAIGLSFNNPVNATSSSGDYVATDPYFGVFNNGYSRTVLNYTNVATGLDARVTATTFGTGYSFTEHLPTYTSAGNSNGDAAFLYQASQFTVG